jgi:hypothetical protein
VKDTKGVQHGGSHDNMPMNTHMLMVPIRLCSPTKRDLRQWQRYLHASLKSFGQTPTQQNKVCSRKKNPADQARGVKSYTTCMHYMER